MLLSGMADGDRKKFFVLQKPMFQEDEGHYTFIGSYDSREDAEAAVEREIASKGPPTPTKLGFYIAS